MGPRASSQNSSQEHPLGLEATISWERLEFSGLAQNPEGATFFDVHPLEITAKIKFKG